jgi:glyoxylase-like metal-dependent hydrolase (beta-lactamase superfamily II)
MVAGGKFLMSLKVKFFEAGYCIHREGMVIRDGKWRKLAFPALFALILHPTIGAILFDTGYTERFFQETKNFLFRLYALTTPVYFIEPNDSAVYQLEKAGIDALDIKYIIISHFHADHIGGLLDFPNAKFICCKSAYQAVKDLRGINALKAGFLAGLLPVNFSERSLFVEDKQTVSLPVEYQPFTQGIDLFGDSSLIAVELPGHAMGQLGLFFKDADNQDYFLIADACWLSRAYQEFVLPHPLTRLIFSSQQDYVDTLAKIHDLYKLNPKIKIIPTHCPNLFNKVKIY